MHEALASSLDGLIASHEELMAIAMEKQEVIIRNEIDALNRLVQRENKLMKAIAEQERERELHARQLAAKLGVPASQPVALSAVIRYMTSAEAKRSLAGRREKLLAVLESLRAQNERNQQLARQALRFVNYSLDLVSYSPMDDVTYRPPSQGYGNGGTSMFNTKA